MKLTSEEKREIGAQLSALRKNPKFHAMRHYRQHGRISTYDHARSVALISFRLDKLLHAHSDRRTLLKAALLHDFYLYDWHRKDHPHAALHGFYHPAVAAKNAKKEYGVSEEVASAIRSHMWPLTLTRIPKSREAALVCLADKIAAARETLFQR